MAGFVSRSRFDRRRFLGSAVGAAVAAGASRNAFGFDLSVASLFTNSSQDRPKIGCIGVGGQGTYIGHRARGYGDVVAVCDVQLQHAERAKEQYGGGEIEVFGDYRKLLDRSDIEVVTIGTPDHWHTAPAIAALNAGKHVYCEKPLTLTIDEGKLLVEAVKKSGKTLQVGTMQRTDMLQFARAVATARSGQLGKIKQIEVKLPGPAPSGGPFAKQPVPDGLDWDQWLGQTPKVDFIPQRCHGEFRWWFEYSGGMMTDWGAHYVDIAHWALGIVDSGPTEIDGSKTKVPKIVDGYNTPVDYDVQMKYGDVLVKVTSGGDHGVLITGEKGRIFVDRGRITGKPIEEQDADASLKDPVMEAAKALFHGNDARLGDHMGNFFDAYQKGLPPVSDVVSQHRVVSACHLANISIRLGRKITWDPVAEKIVGDDEAQAMCSRTPREGYELSAWI